VPWSASPLSALLPGGGAALTSSPAREPPLVVARSFVLPVTVRDIAFTRSRAGVTPPLVLLATSAGGVLGLQKRLLDPRRPGGEPSTAEKAEGLAQYAPVLPLLPSAHLSVNLSVPRARLLATAPTAFESTTLVAMLGASWEAEGREEGSWGGSRRVER
jgi:hypothetical protein